MEVTFIFPDKSVSGVFDGVPAEGQVLRFAGDYKNYVVDKVEPVTTHVSHVLSSRPEGDFKVYLRELPYSIT